MINCKIGQRRIITKSRYDTSSSNLFSKLRCDNLSTRRRKHKAMLMFKTVNELTPHYLRELFEAPTKKDAILDLVLTNLVPRASVHSKNRCVQLHTKVCFITHQGVFNYTPRCVHFTHLPTQF